MPPLRRETEESDALSFLLVLLPVLLPVVRQETQIYKDKEMLLNHAAVDISAVFDFH